MTSTATSDPNADRVGVRAKQLETVIGVDPSIFENLATVGTDPTEVSAGAEMDYTIIGLATDEGGDWITETSDGEPIKEPFESRPQMQIHYRIDEADFDFADRPNGADRITIPKLKFNARTGRNERLKMREGSSQQIFFALLEQQGISSNPDLATVLQILDPTDLIGLQVHREAQAFPNPYQRRDPSARNLIVPVYTAVYGFDNEVRKAAKLPEMVQTDSGKWERKKGK